MLSWFSIFAEQHFVRPQIIISNADAIQPRVDRASEVNPDDNIIIITHIISNMKLLILLPL